MSLSRRRFLHISASAGLVPMLGGGCDKASVLWEGKAFGAYARIQLAGLSGWRLGAEQIRTALIAEIRRMEHLFSLFVADSSLSRLNREGVLYEPDPDFAALFRLSDTIHRLSGGLFDPSIQTLWLRLYEGRDPAEALNRIGWERVLWQGADYSLQEGQALSFNGIAQGFATDVIVALLRRFGAKRTLVNLGEFAAIGGPWRLGTSDPQHGLVDVFDLSDGAVATSSPAAMLLGGGRSHILHPALARDPVWSSVSVEAGSAAMADGLSTAICLMEPEELQELRQRLSGRDGVYRILHV